MVARTHVQAGMARRTRSLFPLNWGVLLLFVLFTTIVGVREAQAQPELTLAACGAACFSSSLFRDLKLGFGCAACMIYYGRTLQKYLWGPDGWAGGWDCAKADIGC